MTTIHAGLALDLMNQAVKMKGSDHLQNVCTYVVADVPSYWFKGKTDEMDYIDALQREDADGLEPKPGCLVGTALWIHDKDALLKAIGQGVNGGLIGSEVTISALAQAGIEISDEALALFDRAQQAQDGRRHSDDQGTTWGQAVAYAVGSNTIL